MHVGMDHRVIIAVQCLTPHLLASRPYWIWQPKWLPQLRGLRDLVWLHQFRPQIYMQLLKYSSYFGITVGINQFLNRYMGRTHTGGSVSGVVQSCRVLERLRLQKSVRW